MGAQRPASATAGVGLGPAGRGLTACAASIIYHILWKTDIFSLTRHRLGYWSTLECLGGGAYHAPLLSREPLFVESRARWHSKALDKTLQNHLSELKIEVTCKVKVRSKVKIRRFDVLGPGDQDYRTWWLKLRHNVVKGMVKIWYEYKCHTKKT